MPPHRIRIEPSEVIHETLDGEVILISLHTGCYYSLEGAGAEIWAAFLEGRSVDAVAEGLERRYAADPGAIGAAVADLAERLLAERLAHPADGADADGAGPALVPAPVPGPAERTPFQPPVLHRFTDMQDFLLIDPIHDVEDEGWPFAQAGQQQ